MRTILINNDRIQPEHFDSRPDYVAKDLLDAANYILEQERVIQD